MHEGGHTVRRKTVMKEYQLREILEQGMKADEVPEDLDSICA